MGWYFFLKDVIIAGQGVESRYHVIHSSNTRDEVALEFNNLEDAMRAINYLNGGSDRWEIADKIILSQWRDKPCK